MGTFERKLRRKKEKEIEEDLAEKTALMGALPENCLMCEDGFDRTNREQVSTWRVVVREEEKKVNLYCPSCWDNAIKLLKEIEKDMEERNVH